jgi:hypothetical protein
MKSNISVIIESSIYKIIIMLVILLYRNLSPQIDTLQYRIELAEQRACHNNY